MLEFIFEQNASQAHIRARLNETMLQEGNELRLDCKHVVSLLELEEDTEDMIFRLLGSRPWQMLEINFLYASNPVSKIILSYLFSQPMEAVKVVNAQSLDASSWDIIKTGFARNLGPKKFSLLSSHECINNITAMTNLRDCFVSNTRTRTFHWNHVRPLNSEMLDRYCELLVSSNIEDLAIAIHCFQAHQALDSICQMSNLRRLFMIGKLNLTDATRLLQASPYLEQIRIDIRCDGEDEVAPFIETINSHGSLKHWKLDTSLEPFIERIIQSVLREAGLRSRMETFLCWRDEDCRAALSAIVSPNCRLRRLGISFRPGRSHSTVVRTAPDGSIQIAPSLSPKLQSSEVIAAIEANCFIERIQNHPPRLDHFLPKASFYYCMLNRCGRRLLNIETERISLQLWPHMFSAVDRRFETFMDVEGLASTYSKAGWTYQLLRGPFLNQLLSGQ